MRMYRPHMIIIRNFGGCGGKGSRCVEDERSLSDSNNYIVLYMMKYWYRWSLRCSRPTFLQCNVHAETERPVAAPIAGQHVLVVKITLHKPTLAQFMPVPVHSKGTT